MTIECTCGFTCGTGAAFQRHQQRYDADALHDHQQVGSTGSEVRTRSAVDKSELTAEASASDCCRICLDGGKEDEPLLSVCNCTGSHRWVHGDCLRRWQISVQMGATHPDAAAAEERHRICGICKTPFRGLPPLDRESMLGELANLRPSEIRPGVLMRYAEDFPVPNVDRALLMLFDLMKVHFEHAVYLIMSEVPGGASDGTNALRGVNLTRNLESHWGPSESVAEKTKGELTDADLAAWRREGFEVAVHLGGPVKPRSLGPALLLSPEESGGYAIGDYQSLRERAAAAAGAGVHGVQLRLFIGYAQWSREQLMGEVARQLWGLAGEASPEDLRIGVKRLWRTLEEDGRCRWAPNNAMADEHRQRMLNFGRFR